jgi:hypothetical protein
MQLDFQVRRQRGVAMPPSPDLACARAAPGPLTPHSLPANKGRIGAQNSRPGRGVLAHTERKEQALFLMAQVGPFGSTWRSNRLLEQRHPEQSDPD